MLFYSNLISFSLLDYSSLNYILETTSLLDDVSFYPKLFIQQIIHLIAHNSTPKSAEILMFVCLQTNAKQCCNATKLDRCHCASHSPGQNEYNRTLWHQCIVIFVETDIKMSQDLAAILIQMLLKTIFQFLGIRHGGEVEIPAQSNVVELIAYLSGIVAGARVTHKSSVRLLKHLHFNISSSLDYLETTCLLDNV